LLAQGFWRFCRLVDFFHIHKSLNAILSCAASTATMQLPLLQLLLLKIAAWQYLLPAPLPSVMMLFPQLMLGVMVVGLSLGVAAAVISNTAAWCCCGCFPVSITCHFQYHPDFWHMAIAVHRHPSQPLPSTVAITVDYRPLTVAVTMPLPTHAIPITAI